MARKSDLGCVAGQCSGESVTAEIAAGKSADASTVLVSLGVVSAVLGVTLIVTRPRAHLALGLGVGRASVGGTF